MACLKDIGEVEAIRRLTAQLPGAGTPDCGIGDDTAVVPVAGSAFDQLLTTGRALKTASDLWREHSYSRIQVSQGNGFRTDSHQYIW